MHDERWNERVRPAPNVREDVADAKDQDNSRPTSPQWRRVQQREQRRRQRNGERCSAQIGKYFEEKAAKHDLFNGRRNANSEERKPA